MGIKACTPRYIKTTTMETVIKNLSAFLKRYFPNDILMPIQEGTKHPMFPHKNGAWSWEKFDKYYREHPDLLNVCIVLHDLCVIDIDSLRLIHKYEALFPEELIRGCPMEATARGRHYWFARPKVADTHGYYDGAGQRESGVDFKSIHSNGTGGIVVVAPSTGKTWIQPLWKTTIIEMPENLLNAVAVPKHKVIEMAVQFDDCYGPVVVENKWLGMMSYFDDKVDDVVRIPCTKASFDDLIATLETNDLMTPQPSGEFIDNLVKTAQTLGLPARLINTLNAGIPRMHVDIHDKCPEWWRAMFSEKMWLMDGARDDTILCNVPADLGLGARLEKDERFLLPKHAHSFSGTLGIREAISVCDEVRQILLKYPGKVVLAGGSALSSVVSGVPAGEDFDLFVVGVDSKEEANGIVNEIREMLGVKRTCVTRNAVSFFLKNGEIVQIILRLYENIGRVLVGFDLHPCKVGVYSEDGQTIVAKCSPTWVEAIAKMAFPIDLANWSRASAMRIVKYMAKGFDVFVPGLRREALLPVSQCSTADGLRALFWCEYLISSSVVVGASDVRLCASRLWHVYGSDYSLIAKMQGRIQYLIRRVYWWAQSFFLGWYSHVISNDREFSWVTCELRNHALATTFNPCSLRLFGTYDMRNYRF